MGGGFLSELGLDATEFGNLVDGEGGDKSDNEGNSGESRLVQACIDTPAFVSSQRLYYCVCMCIFSTDVRNVKRVSPSHPGQSTSFPRLHFVARIIIYFRDMFCYWVSEGYQVLLKHHIDPR